MPQFKIHPARLSYTADGRLYNQDYDDIYFQPENGVEESSYVFLDSNHLTQRFSFCETGHRFRIAELGFGSGLNFLLSWDLWEKHAAPGAQLSYVSFEKHPILRADLEKIYTYFPALAEKAAKLLAQYPEPISGFHSLSFDGVDLVLGLGDITDLLPQVTTKIDAWFLDGFAPAKNPVMWDNKLFQHMADITAAGGSFSTFTAAGAVKRGLADVGFTVEKIKGYGRKRDMLIGQYKEQAEAKPTADAVTEVIVIGAGIAGSSAAYALAKRGARVTVLEKEDAPAQQASGNAVGVVYPRLTAAPSDFGNFYQHAFGHTTRLLSALGAEAGWRQTGVVILDHDAGMEKKNTGIVQTCGWPETGLRYLQAEELTEIAGVTVTQNGLYYPQGGCVDPRLFCQALLSAYPHDITCKTGVDVACYRQGDDGMWTVYDGQGQGIATAPYLIVASGTQLQEQTYSAFLPLRYVRGQVTHLKGTDLSRNVQTVISHQGYITPIHNGQHCLGATFQKLDACPASVTTEQADDHENIAMQQKHLPHLQCDAEDILTQQSRAGLRTTTIDHLPVIGPCPVAQDWNTDYFGLWHGKITADHVLSDKTASYYKGLYLCGALGSHGMTTAPYAGAVLASMICGDPVPATQDVRDAIHPGRFILRALKRRETAQG